MAFGDPSSNFFQSSAAREEEDKSASALDFNAPNRDDPLIMRMPSWRQSMGLRTPGPAQGACTLYGQPSVRNAMAENPTFRSLVLDF
jgi:hypothetical protein